MDTFRSATGLADAIRAGDVSPVDLVEACLDRIEADVTDAFVTVLDDEARRRAHEAEHALERGDDWGPLHGVPVAVKDLTFTKAGVRYTMGAAPLADNVADRTSVAVERLEAAGAIVLGTTNTPELGHTVRTDNELVGPTATPFDRSRNAGGSSGGSAAALAAGLCALATGSDVGGSLRNPASCCGVVSVKPTFGLVPKDTRPNAFYSHTPFGVLGPMARTVEDAGLALDVLAGRDDRDPFSVPATGDYRAAAADPAFDVDLAYSPDLDDFAVEPEVRETTRGAVEALADEGASVAAVEVGGPAKADLAFAFSKQATVYFGTVAREVREAHGVDLREGEVQDSLVRTLGMAEGHEALDVADADRERTALYDAVEAVLADHDVLAVPALATLPLTHDEPLPTEIDGEAVSGLPTDWSLAWPFNLTGHPVVHVPAGTVGGLPVGLQLVGPRHGEERLLSVARAFEAASPWSYPG